MPDASLYYPATPHESALVPLTRAIDDDEGLMVLTGDAGRARRSWAKSCSIGSATASPSAFLTNGHYADRAALLQGILFDLGLPFEDGAEQVLRLRLTDFILKNCEAGKRLVVVVDEAHYLSVDLLGRTAYVGQPGSGYRQSVSGRGVPPSLASSRRSEAARADGVEQRMAVQAHLGPLGVEEAYDYLLHHLRLAARPRRSSTNRDWKFCAGHARCPASAQSGGPPGAQFRPQRRVGRGGCGGGDRGTCGPPAGYVDESELDENYQRRRGSPGLSRR